MSDATDTADHRPDVYVEHETQKIVYRASSLGNCIRSLTAIRMGTIPAPFPEKFRKVFADGQRGEAVIIEEVEKTGWLVIEGQAEVELIVGQSNAPGTLGYIIVVRGHVDGLAYEDLLNNGGHVLECKTTASKIQATLQAKYDWQISVYMEVYGLPGLFAVGQKDGLGNVIRSTVKTHTVYAPPHPLSEIIERVLKIEKFAELAVDPPCDSESKYPCSTYWLHEEDPFARGSGYVSTPVAGNLGGGSSAIREDAAAQRHTDTPSSELDALATAYKRYDAQEKEAKAGKEMARRELLDLLGDLDKQVTERWKVTRSVSARKTIDGDAMKAAGMEVLMKESEVERLTVTEVKG
jgi:hypothetical protein